MTTVICAICDKPIGFHDPMIIVGENQWAHASCHERYKDKLTDISYNGLIDMLNHINADLQRLDERLTDLEDRVTENGG